MTELQSAVYTLEAAAGYLMDFYWNGELRRNEGWGNNLAERAAWHILRRLVAEMSCEL